MSANKGGSATSPRQPVSASRPAAKPARPVSALRQGIADGLPFLFFGLVCFVISYELFGSAAHLGNSTIPLWILPLAIGAIASGTGVVGAFSPEKLPGDAVL